MTRGEINPAIEVGFFDSLLLEMTAVTAVILTSLR